MCRSFTFLFFLSFAQVSDVEHILACLPISLLIHYPRFRQRGKLYIMPRKKRPPITLLQKLQQLKASGMDPERSQGIALQRASAEWDKLPDLKSRIQKILGMIESPERSPSNMLFFVMYDIESNKVRRLVAKYLEEKGCTRVQKSIFLADLPIATYESIRKDLTEVQACYENQDSIMVVPVSTDMMRSMKVIGKNLSIDLITHSRTTLFF